jgi:hypothetical protein
LSTGPHVQEPTNTRRNQTTPKCPHNVCIIPRSCVEYPYENQRHESDEKGTEEVVCLKQGGNGHNSRFINQQTSLDLEDSGQGEKKTSFIPGKGSFPEKSKDYFPIKGTENLFSGQKNHEEENTLLCEKMIVWASRLITGE